MGEKRKIIFLLVVVTSLLPSSAKAGLMVMKGSVDIKALESVEVCDAACVFSTYSSLISCRIEGSKEINKFLQPSGSFQLTENILDCPQESSARRECIASNCSLTSKKARLVCLSFKGPFEVIFKPSLELYPEKLEYRGALRAVCQVGNAVTVEPLDFWVYFYPINIFPLGLIITILIVLILFFWINKNRIKITF
ncbi:MAG: hypothetical protein NZ942_01760 [Candidatus Aenigmarchaeota archaeon]|nr:hypothetical protein [Candidatus Aenigmarchaeota archaeon]